ncbi:related to alpha-amylase A precursor [Cephalotrichum gorgonifer]|uniref:Alpha-amylase n=1 Tax=Cephalotrichum gorgonifer TaxID=2041049 RepID=A0AAE8MWS7_9PEZI|nr:related to alpha-amylase A precursor [Cephalotrichum gorgonifer]
MKATKALLAALLSAPAVLGAGVDEWRSRNIYFALTDRFAKDGSDTNACGNLGNYCGGTFKGLESKLDYIQGMGFDAIWITPVVQNTPGGYHGYWAKNLYEVNENYGTADDLKSFINAAHDRGIYVMVDVVANHMGAAPFDQLGPAPFNQESSYHSKCEINYNDQNSIEKCWIAGLPDVATEKPEVRQAMKDWIAWIINEYKFDGARIDTVKHVEKDFWSEFSAAAGVYTVGEVWDPNLDYLADYARHMDGLLDYGIYYQMNDFYQQKGSAQNLVAAHDQVGNKFPDPTALATFLDNHDNPRWLSLRNDHTLLKNCLTYVMLSRGIPIVYYGTEQGYAGGHDPANREDLWRSGFNTGSDLYDSISRLSKAKSAAGGLGGNDHVHLWVGDNVYIWGRAGSNLIAVTTNAGAGFGADFCFNSQKPNGSWTDVFSGDGKTYTSDGSGNLCVTVSNGLPAVLVASGLEPEPQPTAEPTPDPTSEPTEEPTSNTEPEPEPTAEPTSEQVSTTESEVTVEPTLEPEPTAQPTNAEVSSSENESTAEPTNEPTSSYEYETTVEPTNEPSSSTEPEPTAEPTSEEVSSSENESTAEPTEEPTSSYEYESTAEPTEEPTSSYEYESSVEPTEEPTSSYEYETTWNSEESTAEPTNESTSSYESEPTAEPTEEPTSSYVYETTWNSEESTAEATSAPTSSSEPEPTEEPTSNASSTGEYESTAEATTESTSGADYEPTSSLEPTSEPTSSSALEPTATKTCGLHRRRRHRRRHRRSRK